VDEAVGEAIARLPEVEEVAGMTIAFVPMPDIPYFVLFGHDPDGFAIGHFQIVEGEGLAARASRGRGKPILLGHAAADNLGQEVGDTVQVHGSAYRVVGIYETGAAFEDGGAVVTLDEAQALLKQPRQVTAFLLRLKDVGQLEAARRHIERRFPDLAVSRTSEVIDRMGGIDMIRVFVWGLSLITILVGGVGMMNTMVMSVVERTREIGLLRSLGWRRSRVLALILGESLALSVLGGLAGTVLGVVLIEAAGRVPGVASLAPGVLTPGLVLGALAVALALGVVGGLYPAWRAARLVPLEALRYEGGGGGRLPHFLPGGMILGGLFRRRARTALTVVGVAVGVTAMVAIGAWVEGINASISTSTLATGADLMVLEADIADMQLGTIEERVGAWIGALPQVAHVSGGVSGLVAFEGMPVFSVRGYHPAGYAMRRFKIVEGEGLSSGRQILIGRRAADILGKGVGDRVLILSSAYRVVGIYETGDVAEERGGVIALRHAQTLFNKPHQVTLYAIKVQERDEVDEVARRIRERFPDLSVTLSADFAESTPDIQMMGQMTGVMFWLAVLIGAVGLVNTLGMSVMERTREIGVLRALGWRKRRVLALIVGESLALTLRGGAIGVCWSWAMVRLLALRPSTASIGLRLTPGLLAQALALAVVLGAVGGVYPAWRATSLRPVEALRYE
jgi:ABC-type lipoprotein release transport system permease subunit